MSFIPQTRNYKTISGLSNLQRSIYQVEFTIVPQKDIFYDLGQSNLRWGSVYTGQVMATSGTSQISNLNVTNALNVQGQNGVSSTFQDDVNVLGQLTTNSFATSSSTDATSRNDTAASFYTPGGIACNKSIYSNTINTASNATFGGNLGVTGNTTLTGTLGVTGTATFGTVSATSYVGLPVSPSPLTPPVTIGTLSDTTISSYSTNPTTNIVTPTCVLSTPSINVTQQLTSPWISVMGLATVDKLYSTNTTDATSSTDSAAACKLDGGLAVSKSVYTGGNMIVTGNSTIGGTFGTTGNTTVGGSLVVNSTTEATGTTAAFVSTGGIYCSKRLRIGSVDSGFTTPSLYTAGSAYFTKDVTCNTTLGVNSNATVQGTLDVTGVSTLSGNATVGGTLGVTGATTLSSTLGVTGVATLSNNATVGGTLGVTGNTSVSSTTESTGTSGSLTTAGGIYCAKRLRIGSTDSGFVTPSFSTAGSAYFAKDVTCNTTLSVNGNTTLSGTLSAGATTVSGLTTGDAVLNGYMYGKTNDCRVYAQGGTALLAIGSADASIQTPSGAFQTYNATNLGAVNGTVKLGATGGTFASVSSSGVLEIRNTTDSTTNSTGSVIFSGGLGVAKAVNIGTTLGVSGLATFSSGLSTVGLTASKIGSAGITVRYTLQSDATAGNNSSVNLAIGTYYVRQTAAAPSDTLVATSTLISTNAAFMSGSVWNDYEYFDIALKNECAGNWVINRGDANLIFGGAPAATSYTVSSGLHIILRLMKLSSTTLMAKIL